MKHLALLSLCILLVSCSTTKAEQEAASFAQEGIISLDSSDFANAQQSFAKAFRSDATQAGYLYNQLLATIELKQFAQALLLSKQGQQSFPAHLEFLLAEGTIQELQTQYSASLHTFLKLLALNPGDYQTKANVMEKALEWGMNVEARNLAMDLLSSGEQAKRALTVLSELDGEKSWASYLLKDFAEPTKEVAAQSPEPQMQVSR